jgi:hypothetical protein
MSYPFWIIFAVLSLIIIICDRKYYMLRDMSTAAHPPYSWSRVQLAWWTVIILSSFIAIFWAVKDVPSLDPSTLILLGISATTTATARAIDVADQANPLVWRHQDLNGSNFFLDIISDQNGPSIHRFQAIVFNFVFGVWFITKVLGKIGTCPDDDFACINAIIPVVSDNNLLLLGLSSATYAAVKTLENRSTPATTNPPATSAAPANTNPPG